MTDIANRILMEKILKLADNHDFFYRNQEGIFFTYEDPADEMVDRLRKMGAEPLYVRREFTFFVSNEMLEKFRKEVG